VTPENTIGSPVQARRESARSSSSGAFVFTTSRLSKSVPAPKPAY
jgi:hypothetical protein